MSKQIAVIKHICLDCGASKSPKGNYCKSCGYKHRTRPRGLIYNLVNPNPTIFKKNHKTWNKGLVGFMAKENNPNWKGGKQKTCYGYLHIMVKNHPLADNKGRVFEHRLVMEKHLGRYLTKEEVIHHINRKRNDNRLENLMLFKNHSEHMKHHGRYS